MCFETSTHRSRLWCVKRPRSHTASQVSESIRTLEQIYGRLTRTPSDAATSPVALYSASEPGAEFSYTHRNVQLQHSTLLSTRYRPHIVHLARDNDTGFIGIRGIQRVWVMNHWNLEYKSLYIRESKSISPFALSSRVVIRSYMTSTSPIQGI
jgi:hypothetical protein